MRLRAHTNSRLRQDYEQNKTDERATWRAIQVSNVHGISCGLVFNATFPVYRTI